MPTQPRRTAPENTETPALSAVDRSRTQVDAGFPGTLDRSVDRSVDRPLLHTSPGVSPTLQPCDSDNGDRARDSERAPTFVTGDLAISPNDEDPDTADDEDPDTADDEDPDTDAGLDDGELDIETSVDALIRTNRRLHTQPSSPELSTPSHEHRPASDGDSRDSIMSLHSIDVEFEELDPTVNPAAIGARSSRAQSPTQSPTLGDGNRESVLSLHSIDLEFEEFESTDVAHEPEALPPIPPVRPVHSAPVSPPPMDKNPRAQTRGALVTAEDGITPTAAYVEAREAALRAVRASKAMPSVAPRQPRAPRTPPPEFVQPPLHANAPPATSERVPSISQDTRDGQLNRSYTSAMAAIGFDDLEPDLPSVEPPAVTPPIVQTPQTPLSPAVDDLSNIYGDDDKDDHPLPHAAQIVSPESTSNWGPNPAYSKRHSQRRIGPVPGLTGAVLPVERNPLRMGIGGILISAGLFLLLWYLPSNAPSLSSPDIGGPGTSSGFTPALYARAQWAAAGFLLAGVLFILDGLLFKPQSEVVCKRCKRYVIGKRNGVVLECPRSSHTATFCRRTITLGILLILSVTGTLITIAMGSITRVG